jgi:hypothetical protein
MTKTKNAPSTGSRINERVAAVLAELRAMGSERDRVGMARHGINVEDAFGVSDYELPKVAKRLGTDHDTRSSGARGHANENRRIWGNGWHWTLRREARD